MKSTLDLHDETLRAAKVCAAAEGVTLTAFVEDALRARLAPRPSSSVPFRLQLKSVKGNRRPAVDLSDRDALYDLMDGR